MQEQWQTVYIDPDQTDLGLYCFPIYSVWPDMSVQTLSITTEFLHLIQWEQLDEKYFDHYDKIKFEYN